MCGGSGGWCVVWCGVVSCRVVSCNAMQCDQASVVVGSCSDFFQKTKCGPVGRRAAPGAAVRRVKRYLLICSTHATVQTRLRQATREAVAKSHTRLRFPPKPLPSHRVLHKFVDSFSTTTQRIVDFRAKTKKEAVDPRQTSRSASQRLETLT